MQFFHPFSDVFRRVSACCVQILRVQPRRVTRSSTSATSTSPRTSGCVVQQRLPRGCRLLRRAGRTTSRRHRRVRTHRRRRPSEHRSRWTRSHPWQPVGRRSTRFDHTSGTSVTSILEPICTSTSVLWRYYYYYFVSPAIRKPTGLKLYYMFMGKLYG